MEPIIGLSVKAFSGGIYPVFIKAFSKEQFVVKAVFGVPTLFLRPLSRIPAILKRPFY